MSVYAQRFAELYDVFHGDKPYETEAAFVDRLLRAHGEGPADRLLDVACGTGQHASRLADRGWSVLGVDQSEAMLRVAAARAGGGSAQFIQQDMTRLDLAGPAFDAATCLFDSIGYAVTDERIVATFAGIRRHLRERALLLVEYWHAAPMVDAYDPLRVREWVVPGGSVLRIGRTALDVAASTATVSYDVLRLGPNGRYDRWQETHVNRFFVVDEMNELLRSGGFEVVSSFDGFSDAAPVDDSTWHVLALARATAPVA